MSVLQRFERGEGELVALLHGAASHSGQWRALIAQLTPTYRTIAWDQYGYRGSPAWSELRPLQIHDQVAPLLSHLQAQSGPIHIIGHSHGATLAALLATQLGDRVSSLMLYEPNNFGVLDHTCDKQRAEYESVRAAFGDLDARMSTLSARAEFAQDLLNFWLGPQAWDTLSERVRAQLIESTLPTSLEVYAALHDTFEVPLLRTLGERLLLAYDPHTPPLALAVTRRYRELLSGCTVETLPHAGHLGPITHAERFNQIVMNHLARYTHTHYHKER